MVELAISIFVLLLFAGGLLATAQVVGEYMAVRAAASQAAFAAARAPSLAEAERAGQQAGLEAAGGRLQNFQLQIDSAGFVRGGTLTATASGCVSLSGFPLAAGFLGPCVKLRWQARALIEPFRSRSAT
jgi:Flp pilus assembly protein TadG